MGESQVPGGPSGYGLAQQLPTEVLYLEMLRIAPGAAPCCGYHCASTKEQSNGVNSYLFPCASTIPLRARPSSVNVPVCRNRHVRSAASCTRDGGEDLLARGAGGENWKEGTPSSSALQGRSRAFLIWGGGGEEDTFGPTGEARMAMLPHMLQGGGESHTASVLGKVFLTRFLPDANAGARKQLIL